MNNKNIFFSALFMLVSFGSFGQMVGADRDANGCIGSAGYTYSVLKKECIRIFEQEILLVNLNESTGLKTQTCVIFSADEKEAEVFMFDGSFVLKRKGKPGAYTWKKGAVVLEKEEGYIIKMSGEVLFK